ncbi:MAG: lytic transglycosylase domain-containing protein [Ginsengibacter sp.]
MSPRLFIITTTLCFLLIDAKSSFGLNNFFQPEKGDTTILQKEKEENTAIDEVITSPTPPKEEKVKYVAEVTKYGFKNLFSNYSYNPAIPYSSQVNPHAETYMQDYLQAHGKSLEKMKATALPYFNLIDGILVRYGLPKELKYLAVIESDLKSNALSFAGARGPWQFMSYTAKGYGLRVNENVDDRIDYDKSTNAAAKYLLSLYKDFKEWLLVIAAYNGGPGRVYTAIRKSGSRNFWKLQYYLPEESRNHVKKFIATHYVMETKTPGGGFDYTHLNDSSGISKPDLTEIETANSVELAVSGRYNAKIIARNINMDMQDFNRYNPGFDDMLASGGTYKLRLPNDRMDIFIVNKYPILNESVNHLLEDVSAAPKPANKKVKSKLP